MLCGVVGSGSAPSRLKLVDGIFPNLHICDDDQP